MPTSLRLVALASGMRVYRKKRYQRAPDHLGGLISALDLSSVTDRDHHDDEQPIIDCVDDAVITHSYPPSRSPATLSRRWRTGIYSQQGNRAPEPFLGLVIELPQLARSGRPELDSIAAHVHPRSCFTCSQGMLSPSSDIAASNAEMSSISSSASIISS